MTAVIRAQCLVVLLALCAGTSVALPVPAEAGEYYTRKRVNGVWITGKFKRKAALAGAPETIKASEPAVAVPPPLAPMPVAISAPAAVQAPSNSASAPDDYMLRLKRGLEARALAMVTRVTPEPRVVVNVVFDYLRRTKITTYSDGARSEDGLDPVATGSVSAVSPQ